MVYNSEKLVAYNKCCIVCDLKFKQMYVRSGYASMNPDRFAQTLFQHS